MEKKCKKSAQRLLALVLCVAMLLPVFPQSVRAEELSGAVLQSATPVNAEAVLSGLPYKGGQGSANILPYDCGNGLTNDGATSAIRIIRNTSAAEFNTYCSSVLEAKGLVNTYSRDTASSEGGTNLFRKYRTTDGSYSVYTYFLSSYKEVRIIVDSNRDTVQGYQYTNQTGKTVEPLMVQWGLSTSSSGYHIDTTKTVNGSVLNTGRENNGSLIIIRMPDNSLFFYDGGILAQMSDEAAAELLAFCRELTGTTATREKMVINTWFLSHAHDDHFQGFTRFININHEEFDLKNIVYNIDISRDLEGDPSSTTAASKYIAPAMQSIKGHYPNVRYYKPHTGEVFNVAGIQFDVMYAHEDRLLPDSSNQLDWAKDARYTSSPKDIWDLGGTYRDGLYLRKNGSIQTQDGLKRSDFNDTSTVLKVTFPQSVNGGSKDVTAILYADMNLAEEIVKNVHPASALTADIIMVPHHGFDAHAALVTNKAKIFLYTQNYKPIFGTGVFCRTDLRDNFKAMFPNQTTPGGNANDSYKIYWGGNETAIINIKQVSNLSSTAKRDAIAACVETREGMDFPYTGWTLFKGSDLDQTGVTTLEGYVNPSTVTTGTTITNTKQIRFTPMTSNKVLIQEGRYLIMSSKYGYIMSHDATLPFTIGSGDDSGTDTAGSFTLDTDGNSLDTYYFDGSNVILDHSDRDHAIWNLRQYSQGYNACNDGKVGTSNGTTIAHLNWSNFSGKGEAGELYLGIELQKRPKNYSGNDNPSGYNPSDVYWYSKELAIGSDFQTRFLCYNTEASPFKNQYRYEMQTTNDHGTSGLANRQWFIFEDMGDNTYVIYFKVSDKDFYFVRCDEYGTWGVKRYTAATDALTKKAVTDDLENLKVKLYAYEELSSNKKVALSGYKTYRVSVGTSADAVMSAIMENVVVSDPTRQNQHIPCSGVNWTSAKVGYYFLRWGTNEQPVTYLPNTPGTYKVGVYYCNDRNAGGNDDFDPIGTVDVIVKDVTYSMEDSQKEGYVSQNSYSQVHLATNSAETAKFIFDGEVMEVTVGMLKNADGTPVDTSVSKDYTGLKVVYSGYTICDNFTLHVEKGTIPADIPAFPAPGSVKADKDATTSNEQFAQTGVANIQLSAAAMPIEKGIDLIIMLDLSSSMRYQVSSDTQGQTADQLSYVSHPTHLANGTLNPSWSFTDWQKTRMYAMEKSLSSLITTLHSSGVDVHIAMADFGDLDHYEFENAVIDPNRRAWPQLEHNLVDANSAAVGNLEFNYRNEIANHRNFILGWEDPEHPENLKDDITKTFRSQPFALSYRKYGPSNLSYGYDWVVNGSTDKSYNATSIRADYYGKILPKVYTGSGDVSGDAFESVATLNAKMGTPENPGTVIQALRESNSKLLGTNYDVGLEYAYRLAYERQQQNIANGEEREIVCIFMSDGAALQFNYFSGRTHSEAWSQAIIGNTDEILQDSEDEIKTGTTNDKNAYAWDLTRDANGNLKYYSYMHSTVQQKLQHMHQHLANGSLQNPSKENYNRCSCGSADSPNAKGENFFAHLIAANSTESVSWYRFFRIMSTNADNGNLANYKDEENVKQRLFQELSQPDNKKLYQTDSPYWYFYNPEGKNWWAEAIKGDEEKIYPVINKYALGENSVVGAKPTAYNGEYTNKYAPTLAEGETAPAWHGQDYISGFKGLGMKLYTVGFSLLDERQISAAEAETVLKNLCTAPQGYYYSAGNTAELDAALAEIVKKASVSATLTYYTDTMGAEFDLATNQFVSTPSGASAQVSTNAYVEAKAYTLNGYGVRTGAVTTIEKITFATNGSKSATSDQLDSTDIWDDTTNIITGKKIIYNANKAGTNVDVNKDGKYVLNDGDVVNGQYKIDLTGDGVGDIALQPETFFWSIGFLSETEVVLEYQVYLEGSKEGEKQYKPDIHPTNTQATLDFYDYLGNNRTIETVSPKYRWGGTPQISHGFYVVDESGNPIYKDGKLWIIDSVDYADIALNSSGNEGEKQYTETSVDKIASALFDPSIGYELYNPDAYYTVVYNEAKNDNTYNSWTTSDTTNTTYVSINEGAYSKATSGGATTPNTELNRTQVLFAVVQRTPGLVANKYVEAVDGSPNNFTLTLEAYTKFGACGLNSDSILKEVLTDYFVLDPNNVNAVKVYTYACTGFNNGEPSFAATGTELTRATVNLSSTESSGRLDTIEISGFDYAANYLRANGNNLGCKLVVKVSIKTRDGFWGGNNVPTNEAETGIYNPNEDTPVVTFPIPKVNVPVDVKITAENKTYYYGTEGKKGSDLNPVITANGFKVTINNDDTLTPAEDWMDEYAEIVWNPDSQKPSDSVDGKNPDDYTFSVTVKPKAPASDDSVGKDVDTKGKQDEDTSYVSILYPTLTFKDSTTAYNTPVAGYDFVKNDYVSTQWAVTTPQGVPDSEVIPDVEGEAPELNLGFTPVGNVTNFTTDTKVDVTVTAKYEDGTQQRTEDITKVVTFKWQDDCEHKVPDINEHQGSDDSHEFWVHVVNIVPDTVVIDFGLDVLIDVLANDSVSVGSVVAGVNSNDTVPAPSSEDPGFGSTATGDFGTISVVDNNKVQYSINTMSMNDADVFTYAVKDAVTQYYYYSTVTVIPATTIYYEDNFDGLGKIEYGVHSFIRGTTGEIDPPADAAWTYDELGDVQQAEDRPGTTAIDGIDADNLYGYDGSYTNMETFSMGSARKFTTKQEVKENGDIMVTYGTAEFSFCGTGFDVISMTSGQTGTITIEVDGTYYDKETEQNVSVRKTYAVDTYYGYAWKTDDDGKVVWYPVDNDNDTVGAVNTNALYQVPVMKVAGLEYGNYDVTITISYNDFFNHGQYGDVKQYDFYLDAIRIYDPADDGANNEDIENAYKNDNEGWPEYFELRNMLIKANDFNASATDDVVPGVVFIDSTPELGSENGPKKHAISDYANYGPNNELYLAPGQSVAFELKMTGPVASIQLAAKSVGGTATAKCYLLGNETTNVLPDQLSTATDLYYNITSFNTPEIAEENNVVVICNERESAAILSITNIKVTYTEDYTQPTGTKLTITRRSAEAVLNQLNSSVGEEDPGEVINGTIDIVGASLSFEDEILTNLYYTVSGIEATEMGLLTWSSEPANGTIENAENVYAGAQYIAEKDQYMVQTDGIAAKNLGDDIFMRVYAKTADSIVYSDVTKYSPKQYALSRLEKSQNEDLKALCVAMLNYGAAAQEYFGYKTDDLMNASLTAEQQVLVSPYSADLFTGAVAADASKTGAFAKTEGFSVRSASVSFDGAFAINYYFTASAEVAGDVTFCYWSAADYAKAEVLTADNATGVVTMEKQSSGAYWAQITGIAAKELDDTFYAAAVYTDANGNTHCTGVIAYSLSSYCMKNANGSMGELAQATAIYGYHARKYFGMEG